MRHKAWRVTLITYRWLIPHLKQLWQGIKFLCRWLAPRLQQCGRVARSYWHSRPLLFKELTAVTLLILLIVVMNNVGGASSAAVAPTPAASLLASPLPMPTVTIAAR